MRERAAGISVLALAVGLLWAPPAGAATQIGDSSFEPTGNCSPRTRLQSVSPGGQYAAPFAGVITSWSFQRSDSAGGAGIKFKVARPAGGNDFTIVGESEFENPQVGLNTYLARISVQPGDVLGLYTVPPSVFYCYRVVSGYSIGESAFGVEAMLGSTLAFPPNANQQLALSAQLEPDADNDGFGDETQDLCPTDASKQIECVAPTVTITKGPKPKTKKKTTAFEFAGADARVLAGLECSLDGGAFAGCTSPHTVKVKKGKHTFSVRATDQAGNVGAPATAAWKVKKKKK